MRLNFRDAELFFRLHRTLMFFVNQRLRVVAEDVASPEQFSGLAPELRLKVRDALLEHRDLLQTFVDENPARLSAAELAIVQSWQHLVAGKFVLFRQLKEYMVALSTTDPAVAYGVLALVDPFEELVGPRLPLLVEMVLLPFQGVIVYDGLLTAFPISLGPGIRRSLNEDYKKAKARQGIITSLPIGANPPADAAPTTKPRRQARPSDATTDVLAAITGLIDRFCRQHLNDEYAVLCRKLAEKLARKRPSPLSRGQPEAWASGIVRAVGFVNFLCDPSQTPHLRMEDIDRGFGVSVATGSARWKAIRELFDLHRFDPDWTLPSRMDANPLVWMLEVNGLMMDIRHAPREAQEVAFRKGLIPYIPADRQRAE